MSTTGAVGVIGACSRELSSISLILLLFIVLISKMIWTPRAQRCSGGSDTRSPVPCPEHVYSLSSGSLIGGGQCSRGKEDTGSAPPRSSDWLWSLGWVAGEQPAEWEHFLCWPLTRCWSHPGCLMLVKPGDKDYSPSAAALLNKQLPLRFSSSRLLQLALKGVSLIYHLCDASLWTPALNWHILANGREDLVPFVWFVTDPLFRLFWS